MTEFRYMTRQVAAGKAGPLYELEMPGDSAHVWRFKLKGFDNDVPGGRQLNVDLQQLAANFGQDYLLMEARFPANYPAEPFLLRMVRPRCMWYTGHITAGGSVCIEALTLSGGSGAWQPSFCFESILLLVVTNMLNAESVVVRTMAGGGTAGPLRIDLHGQYAPTMAEYSEAEARSAFERMMRQHAVSGWAGDPGSSSRAPAAAQAAAEPARPATAPAAAPAAGPAGAAAAGVAAAAAVAHGAVAAGGVHAAAAASRDPHRRRPRPQPMPLPVAVVCRGRPVTPPRYSPSLSSPRQRAAAAAAALLPRWPPGPRGTPSGAPCPRSAAAAPLVVDLASSQPGAAGGASASPPPQAGGAQAPGQTVEAVIDLTGPAAAPAQRGGAAGVDKGKRPLLRQPHSPSGRGTAAAAGGAGSSAAATAAAGTAAAAGAGGAGGSGSRDPEPLVRRLVRNGANERTVRALLADGCSIDELAAAAGVSGLSPLVSRGAPPSTHGGGAGYGSSDDDDEVVLVDVSSRAARPPSAGERRDRSPSPPAQRRKVDLPPAQHGGSGSTDADLAAALAEIERLKRREEEMAKALHGGAAAAAAGGSGAGGSGLVLAPLPAHWAPMDAVQDGVTRFVVLPLPDGMGDSSGGRGGLPVDQGNVADMVHNGVPHRDALAALLHCRGDLCKAYDFHFNHLRRGGAAAAVERLQKPHNQSSELDAACRLEAERREAAGVLSLFLAQLRGRRSRGASGDGGDVVAVRRIERVQNWRLWTKYSIRKREVEEATSGDFNERQLWHGSPALQNVLSICQSGFDFRLSSTAGALGCGTYFAASSDYSDTYSRGSSGNAGAGLIPFIYGGAGGTAGLVPPRVMPPPPPPLAPPPIFAPPSLSAPLPAFARQHPAHPNTSGAAGASSSRRLRSASRRANAPLLPQHPQLQQLQPQHPQPQHPQPQMPPWQQPPGNFLHNHAGLMNAVNTVMTTLMSGNGMPPPPPQLAAPAWMGVPVPQGGPPPVPGSNSGGASGGGGAQAQAGHDWRGRFAILLCSVVLGRVGRGSSSLRRPPDGCDSVSSSGTNGGPSEIYAVFDNAQAYPLYVIHYD